MLSNTSKYALQAVIYLAQVEDGKRVGIKKMSEDLSLSASFLGKILQVLSHEALLDSAKGPRGGFRLGRSASTIKLMDVVKLFDGENTFKQCLLNACSCTDHSEQQSSSCTVHQGVAPIREDLNSTFSNSTIKDFVKKQTPTFMEIDNESTSCKTH